MWLQTTTCMPCRLAPARHQLAWGVLFWHGRTIWNTLGCHVHAEGHWSCHHHSQPWGYLLYCLYRCCARGPTTHWGPTWQKTLPGSAARARAWREHPQRHGSHYTHITWLGVHFDTVAMTMSVAAEKILDCLILTKQVTAQTIPG